MPTLEQLRGQAKTATTAIVELRRKWKDESRNGTKDEFESFDKASDELTDAESGIKEFEDTEERSNRAAEAEARLKESRGRKTSDESRQVDRETENTKVDADKELRRSAFTKWLRNDEFSMSDMERRALTQSAGPEGGFLSPDEEFVAKLIQAVDNRVFIRGLAEVQTLTSADSLGAPSIETDIGDPTWTTELGTGSEDSSLAFGRRSLTPWPLARRIKVSKTLLRKAALSPESIVRERLAYKLGIVQENNFLNGNGAKKPLGVFVASADGISTARDVSTGNTTTQIKADNLIEVQGTLKEAYWPRANWIFHRTVITAIRKLKDGNGQYLWQPGLQSGVPGQILSMPYHASEYAPNTMTTGLYVGILGDFKNYWIVDALTMQIQRVDELYAETNETGFFARIEADGMPVLEEAFVRCTLA